MSYVEQIKSLASTNKEDKEGLSTLFKVIIPGIREMSFRSCEGLESEIEVVRHYDGGNLGAPKTSRGVQKVNNISFSQGSVGGGNQNKTIHDWYSDVCDPSKKLDKQELSVMVVNSEGTEVAEWRIFNAWPCRWTAPIMSKDNSQLTVEYVSFAHEGIARKR
jgi:phage tail-like protein